MMSNEEEKRCPLCAEEMDWTDQQFKPCKCGYQICVWCWHHIIDMAEKDETEGRCPACRTVYEKDKIVAMQANSASYATVSKNSKSKAKPPKVKPKTNEVKKDLTNVRVMQRKMAYVIGLPLNLADEDILQRKEYFGQYGKVTKVSLSRTAGGAIQQFVNETCSVYITYSKEEEALRCIQSVHGFVLEGRFLRASFGTAKYCHAWLKNMPCNNAACLYLHTIGADEDSFGKDEVAAVHTRSRVQQMVGAGNNVLKRAGSVLPPPTDDLPHSPIGFPEKSSIRSPVSDAGHGSVNSTADITCSLSSKERGSVAVPHKMTTFVDIVGRSNTSGREKDGNIPEDRRILSIHSESSTVSNSRENPGEPYSVSTLFKVSPSNRIGNEPSKRNIPEEPLREDSSLFDNQGPKDTSGSIQRASFLHPSYPANISEDSAGPALTYKKTSSLNDVSVDHTAVYNHEDEAYLPIRCVNSVLNDACQEIKFQNSSKSDRIYRSSNSFSNEEIVEHLRRIGDDNSNDEENSAFDAVESSIISNIMSIDFDSCEDSLTVPSGLSELLDESDGLNGSSWNSLNSDQSGYSFVKQDSLASQVAGSVLPDFGDNREHYLYKPPHSATRHQSMAPPGFSVPARDPPPGFSTCERTSSLPRASSGTRMVNPSSLSSNLLQSSSTGFNTSTRDFDFIDPAILRFGKGNPTNGFKNLGLEMMSPGRTPFDEESRLWLMMQQSANSPHQDSKFSQLFGPPSPSIQQELSYNNNTNHRMGNGISGLEDMYGLSSPLQNYDHSPFKYGNGHISGNGLSSPVVDQRQNYDTSPFKYGNGQISGNGLSSPVVDQRQNYDTSPFKYGNGHISGNSNGYSHGLDEVQQQHKGEGVGMTEVERNERLGGVNNYFPGYGDLMFSSGDVYSRVFGL